MAVIKLEEIVGEEDAELILRVVKRKRERINNPYDLRDFIVTLLDEWPLEDDDQLWAMDRSDVAVTPLKNRRVEHVWSVEEGWL